MRRKHIYIILLILLGVCAAVQRRSFFTRESVGQRGKPGYWHPEWYVLISEEVNQKGITLEIDGTVFEEKTRAEKLSPVMSEEGQVLVPMELLPDAFSCAAFLYGDSQIVLERGERRAEMKPGSRECLLAEDGAGAAAAGIDKETSAGAVLELAAAPQWRDGRLYVPMDVLEQVFSFRWEWDPEENLLSVSSEKAGTYLPASYDYRQKGRAPRVKNQGSLGTCWAFASTMALESSLLPERDVSLSEDHMSLRNSFHLGQNDGGEYTMSMAYLLAWQGPVPDALDPYGDGYSPQGLEAAFHVQEIQVLPEKNYEEIKRAVFLYGGVQSSLYTSMVTGQDDTRYYNKEKGAYCYRGTARPNHDVVIIGWDDNYPKENFVQPPEENGAFICANSWGGEFGEEGYFYVSYFDSNIGIHNILYSGAEETENYDSIYQSDLCGWVGQLGYGKDNAYFANVYTAKSQEELLAVGFYATGPDTSYDIFTVTDVDGSAQFGRRRLAASGKVENAGFYTIPLRRTVEVSEGERFAVIVRITTPDSVHPVAIEYNSPDKELTADLSDGEGYISFRGTSWERVEEKQNCNVCLKAYTRKTAESDEAEMKEN